MINYIWSGLILISLVVSAFNGKLQNTAAAAIDGAKSGLTLAFTLLGVMMLWMGLMRIAAKSGLITLIAKPLRPVMRILFPSVPLDSDASEAITMNIVANLFGMANAATPLGINAIKQLSLLNPNKNEASDPMCMLVVLNTASIQIFPATLIALRQNAGSVNPFEVIAPIWIASIIAVTIGVLAAKMFAAKHAVRGKRSAAVWR